MLPSSGYFQSAPCPFFKSGLCERPHCHFKHAKTVGKATNQRLTCDEIDVIPETSSDLFSILNRTGGPSLTSTDVLQNAYSQLSENVAVKPSSILKAPVVKLEKNFSAVPEYKPTPISQLKQKAEYKPEGSSIYDAPVSRKRKKFEEYDPEEVKYSRKRVSFNLPDDSLEDAITIESSEEELDGDCSAKFSDDEFHEEEEKISPEVTTVAFVPQPPSEEVDKKEINEFSLVDKILDDVSKNEQLIKNFNPLPRLSQLENSVKAKSDDLKPSKPALQSSNLSINIPTEVGNVSKVGSKKSSDSDSIEKTKVGDNDLNYFSSVENVKNESRDKVIENAKPKTSGSESEDQNTKHKLLKEKAKSSKESDKKKNKGEVVKSAKSEKAKVEEKKKSSKEEKVKSSGAERSKTSKVEKLKSKTEEKDKAAKEKDKVKSSKESASKSSKSYKDDKKKSSTKTEVKSSSKEAQSKGHSHKDVKTTSKDSGKKESKHLKDPGDTKHKNEREKTKSSSHDKHAHTKDSHSSKSNPSTSKSSHVPSAHKSTSSHSSQKVKGKEPKKIQDERISSSSVVKSAKLVDDLQPKAGQTSESSDDDLLEVPSTYVDSDVEFDSSNSEMDSDSVIEECWRIFNEATNSNAEESSKPSEKPQHSSKETAVESIPAVGKKRLAHQVEFKRNIKPPRLAEKPRLTPGQVMHNRYLKLQEMYNKQNEQNDSSSFLNSLNKSVSDGTKKHIVAMPSSSLVAAVSKKNKMQSLDAGSTPGSTIVITKGERRIAHVPTAAMTPRPIIPSSYGSKVPTNIRQRYLNSFIDECLKFCLSEDQAYETALDEEKKAYERSTNKTIYLNIAANTLNRLRHRAKEGPPMELPTDPAVRPAVSSTTSAPDLPSMECNKTVSHEMMLAGPRAQKVTYSIERKKTKAPDVVIRGITLYNYLSDYLLTEEQLIANGFPMPHPSDSGRAVIKDCYANKQYTSSDPFARICSRCKKTYYVDEEGNYVKTEECDYHWGRIYKRRIAGSLEARYMCCSGDAESDGCCVGPGHVFEGSDAHLLRGFVRTLPKTPPQDKYYGVYSLDCEMCYTTVGIELTRVTVIGPDLNPVFETYVKPENPVLDYNTRFSGITEEDLVGTTTTIRDVQAILLCMFNDKTILIGHSLESDFKALKLIHKTVVDTSVVFPHKLGPPYKRALRTLLAEKCNKIIQNSVGGHDSHEDAAACMELMLWKIKEDLKCPTR